MLVEVCANGLQSAINAQSAGADRIELCTALGVGGVTPSYGLIQWVKEKLNIPVHVLVRPRSGHFTFTETEFEVMMADIEFCKEIGVEGIVSGVLHANHSLDIERTQKLVEQARPLHFTFHRAFDWIKNPKTAIGQLEGMGVHAILTSGQHATAQEGLENLKEWQDSTSITLMAGGGIHSENALKFKEAGLKAIHLSGTSFTNTVSIQGKIPMNSIKHLAEYKVAVTNEELVRTIIESVK